MDKPDIVHSRVGSFQRRDGFSIEQGRIVAYALLGFPFQILTSRLGVTFDGSFPIVRREGVLAFQQVLIRAVRHHEHLASFPEGVKQEALSEEILEAEEAAGLPLPDVEPKRTLVS